MSVLTWVTEATVFLYSAANLVLTLVEHDDTDDISVTSVIDTDPDTNAVVQTDSSVVLSIPVTAINAAILAPNVTANRDEAADLVISTGLVDTDGSDQSHPLLLAMF